MKTINIILANAPVNNGNRGCVALSISSMFLINEVFRRRNINYELFLPNAGWNDGAEHSIQIGNHVIKYIDCGYPIGDSLKGSVKTLVKSITRKYYHNGGFRQADFVLDIGQGDSFSDIYGTQRFEEIDRIHKVSMFYSKPYCILPQTIGPFELPIIRKQAIKSIRSASMIMVRDHQSYNYVKEYLPELRNVYESIDVAFFLPYTRQQFDNEHIHVGLNISALLWNGGYTKNNQFALKVDYKESIRSIIDWMIKKDNVILHFIPHVVLQERNVENDYEVSYELYREYKSDRIVLSPFFLGPVEAKNYISGLDFFIGARMHATIAAFSSGVPVVPMAYSRKFNGLYTDTLDYNCLVDLKNDTETTVLNTVMAAFERREQLKVEILSRLEGVVKEKKKQLYQHLTEFFQLEQW